MTAPLTLFDLFGEATVDAVAAMWPQRVQPITGLIANWPPDLSGWLAAMNNSVVLSDVRTGATGDRVAVEAKLSMTGVTTYPDGFPFVLGSMPDTEFRVQYADPGDNQIQLFASMSDRGVELVLERVPVEIRLPAGLINPHPKPGGDIPDGTTTYDIGDFRPGHLDDLKISFNDATTTSIFVHVRIHMTEDGEFDIRPSVPISFAKCVFTGIPCLALYDFQLIPNPSIAPNNVHWLRHQVTSWTPNLTGPLDGCFSVRSVYIDPDTAPISDAANWLNSHQPPPSTSTTTTPPPVGGTSDAHAEFVLDDLVVPFYSPWVLPIPRHVTVGVRRRILDKDDEKQVFTFDSAPVRANFSSDPALGLMVEDFFYVSSPDELGLTFDASVVFGQTNDSAGHSDAMAIGITLEEHYTFSLTYKRDFSSTTGMPEPGTGAAATINALLHWEIATIVVDIMTIKLGFSFGKFFGENASFGDSALATVDLFVSMPPTGGSDSVIKLRALDGGDTKFIIEGLGWRLGSFHFEGVKLPDGVVLLIADTVGIVIEELGIRAEDSATYFSFSGGLMIEMPSSFTGSFLVKRLRFRISGDPGAPPFKVDGFFIDIETTVFQIQAGGYYTETNVDGVSVKEFGLTGSVGFGMGGVQYTFGVDFIVGHLKSAAEEFDYLMVQVFFKGAIEISAVELRGIRVLFARNMKPLLQPVDKDSRELRYYTWYKNSDPLTVPGERRLTAWVARNDSIALGLGASVSFAGFGTVAELSAFVLFVYGPDEQALLIVIEIRLLHNPKPIAYLAIELDFKNSLWRGVLGLELKLSDFVSGAPAWLADIGKLTGTIFVGNDPGTFAIGRIADQTTWLTLSFEWNIWIITHFSAGLCLEFVSGGPNGGGFFLRVEGGINAGIVKVKYYAGFGFSISIFDTASHDYAVAVWIEAGLSIVLFGFLNFGISASIDYRNVGSRPSHGELQVSIKLETPWFLPDVTWTFEVTFGDLAPSDLATSTSPLRAAGGTEGGTRKSAALHAERFDTAYANDRASRTFSVNELKAGGPDEATRLANFEADTTVSPISIDATLSIEFAVAVNDKLALSTDVAPNMGDKTSGDLSLTYDLIGIAVRRRARFGNDRAWYALDSLVELPPDFSDPNGVQLTGSLAAETIRAWWDLDELVNDKPATKRLLFNSETPFQYTTSNPAADEQLVHDHPLWPCCNRKETMPIHRLDFEHELAGTLIDTPRLFSDSQSRFTFVRDAYAGGDLLGTTIGSGVIVARALVTIPGVIARMEFDEDVAYCSVRAAWNSIPGSLAFVAFDGTGKIVGTQTVATQPASDFQSIVIGATGPIRRIEMRAALTPRTNFAQASFVSTGGAKVLAIEVDSVTYVGLSDYLDFVRNTKDCDDGSGGFGDGYSGSGKLFFLPNYEYEIALTTRVTIAHPSTTPDSASVSEYLYFKTKGLPGLNAEQRIGEEVEPYVQSAYGGGRGLLYRSEPAVLAFTEDFFVAVPLTLRPAGTSTEHTTLMQMQLVVKPNASLTPGTVITATSDDWIVTHHRIIVPPRKYEWGVRASKATTIGSGMKSTNPLRARLGVLTQRVESSCGLADPTAVVGTALIAQPQGDADPDDPTRELWPASLAHTASVRMEGAPFVQRTTFDDADLTSFDFFVDTGSGNAASWHVTGGAVTVDTGTVRRLALFGDGDWNHIAISVAVQLTGAAAGIAIALPVTGAPSQGLFALIESVSGGRRLVIYSRSTGTEMVEQAQVALPAATDPSAAISLQVMAFDDRIRATVGDLSIEADRNELREGRVALVATGAAQFGNLIVSGLELYVFPFTTSKWRTFREHVLTWPGTLDVIAPDSLGAGTTTSTATALWAATASDVTAAMQPDADAASRDTVFGRWAHDLGLPLKDEVSEVELSKFVVGNQVSCFLIESPEPIDFTSEVTVTLEHRVRRPHPIGGFGTVGTLGTAKASVADTVIGSLLGNRPIATGIVASPSPAPQPIDVQGEIARAESAAGITRIGAAVPSPAAVAPSVQITDIARHENGLDVELDMSMIPAGALSDDRAVFVEQIADGPTPRLRFYTGRVDQPARGASGTSRVHAVESDEVTVLSAHDSILGSDVLSAVSAGAIVAILPGVRGLGGGGVIIGWTYVYEPVTVRVIQDGSARHALIVPVTATLGAGTYRLTLTLDRARWSTTAPADDVNHYHDSAVLTLTL